MSEQKPKGILRNSHHISNDSSLKNDPENLTADNTKFDRQKVLANTKANAQIHSIGSTIAKSHKSLEDDVFQPEKEGHNNSSGKLPDHLKWDEANLYLTEQEKNATMKIDEPKTPYQGSLGSSEYYKDDDDLDGGDLLLGEPELSVANDPTIQNERIVKPEEELSETDDKTEEDHKLTEEERHKKFEQMRKNHYFMKGAILHKHIDVDEEED